MAWPDIYRDAVAKINLHTATESSLCKDEAAFEEEIRGLVVERIGVYLLHTKAHLITHDPDPAAITSAMGPERLINPSDPRQARLTTTYRFYRGNYDVLMKTEKRANVIDLSDKRRVLLFRILTAISMGAIVLLTYWVGDYFGIPLPLRTIPIGSM